MEIGRGEAPPLVQADFIAVMFAAGPISAVKGL
jgi:hypothetical protein